LPSVVIGIVEIAADIPAIDWCCPQYSRPLQRIAGDRMVGRTVCPVEMVETDYVEADTDSLWAELQAEYCCIRQQLSARK
jgi:hypothetical protein